MKKRLVSGLLAGTMVLALAGCGSGTSGNASSATTTAASSAEKTVSVSSVADSANSVEASSNATSKGKVTNYKIGLSIMELTAYTWFQGVVEGAEQWNKENGTKYGVNFEYDVEDSRSDVQTMLQNLDNMQAAGCQGIIVGPADASSAIPTLKECVNNGIPVVVIDYKQETTSDDDKVWSTFVGHDMKALGTEAGKAAVAYLKDEKNMTKEDSPNCLFITVPSSGQTSADRFAGYKEAILAEFPKANIIEEGDSGAHTRDSAQTLMENILARESEIDVVSGHNDAEVVGAYNAAKAEGRTEMGFIGIAGDKDVLGWIQNGDPQWVGEVLQDPVVLGKTATQAMYETLVEKKELPDDYELPEPECITKDNIDQYDWQDWGWLG